MSWAMSRGIIGLALFPLAIASATACGGDDDRPGNAQAGRLPRPYPGCEDEFFGECRYWEEECQRLVFSTVRCLRGSGAAEMPPVTELTPSELEETIMAEVAASEQDAAAMNAYDRALMLLGLAEDGELSTSQEVEAFIETVPAFYSPDTNSVTIVTAEEGQRSGDQYWNTLTLAHEFVHALQDQDHNLLLIQQEFEDTYDAYLATRAAVEGEATLLETFYDTASSGLAQDDVDYRRYFIEWGKLVEEYLEDLSPVIYSPRVFPYSYGARYVFNVFDADGMSAVRDLYSYIPETTFRVLLSETRVDTREGSAPFTDTVPPIEGYELVGEDVLGAWIVSRIFDNPQGDDGELTVATAWQRDQLLVYLASDGNVTVVWRLELASEATAETVSAALTSALMPPEGGGRSTVVEGSLVTLIVSDDGATIDEWEVHVESGSAMAARRDVDPDPDPNADGPTPAAQRPLLRLPEVLRRRGQRRLLARLGSG